METIKRKIIWISLLAVLIVAGTFICFCLVPLEDYVESDALCMKLSHKVEHIDEDHKNCPGCHPFLWRFYVRCNNIERDWDEAKADQQFEEERQQRLEKNNQ